MTGTQDGGRRRPRGPARAAALACAVAAVWGAQLAVPGAASQAAAASEPCRQEIHGEDFPADQGPYPLISQLGLQQAWDLSTGDGVTVGVVDSGVDARHPDLAGAVRDGSEFTQTNDESEYDRSTPPPEQDCEGHGTAIAGLVAAARDREDRMAGVAYDATVYPVRIADGIDSASFNLIAAAIDDAVGAGVGVLNLSFALPTDNEPIREAVARAVAADVVVVAAAGNEGGRSGEITMYPAAYEGVVAVGAVDAEGQPMDASNQGDWVDIAAYGENITLVSAGGSGYRVDSGTSYAAAQVSGVAALVRSRFPDLSAAEVAERLMDSANRVGGERNDWAGAGIVSPYGALTDLPGAADEGTAGRPGQVPIADVPTEEPLLSDTAEKALAWSGCLLLAVVLGLLGAPAIGRAARRGWRAGPDPARNPEDRPRPPAAGPPSAPRPRLDWLDGSDVRSPSESSRPNPRNRTH
ncbi:S8 family serine peptidase [Streptomyces sp. RFCAC02]|uniref:S8 family serine peptidase n=1 Tax=Streptomyces sp. RFCAC02 TaxID=2499143 RepID=UPI00101EF641|nr:S8 family serine peptidase [Streptomyces sp. RFCAC02]